MDYFNGNDILYLYPANPEANGAMSQWLNPTRVMVLPVGPVLVLRLNVPPKSIKHGFTFGTDARCDVLLDRDLVEKVHFTITFHEESGQPMIKNLANHPMGVAVNGKYVTGNQKMILYNNALIELSDIAYNVRYPDWGTHSSYYHSRLDQYIKAMGPTTKRLYSLEARNNIYQASSESMIGNYVNLFSHGNDSFAEHFRFAEPTTGDIFWAKEYTDPNVVATLKRQAGRLKKMNHDHLVSLEKHFLTKEGSLYLLTKEFHGGILTQWKPQCPGDALEIIRQCLLGLQYLHGCGYVHHDIRPENIHIQNQYPVHARIAGAGLAFETSIDTFKATSRRYWSPELFRGLHGRHSTASASDVWSLGLVLLWLFRVFPSQAADEFDFITTADSPDKYEAAIEKACLELPPSVSRLAKCMLTDTTFRLSAHSCLEVLEGIQQEVSSMPQWAV